MLKAPIYLLLIDLKHQFTLKALMYFQLTVLRHAADLMAIIKGIDSSISSQVRQFWGS